MDRVTLSFLSYLAVLKYVVFPTYLIFPDLLSLTLISTDYKALHYVIFSLLSSLPLLVSFNKA